LMDKSLGDFNASSPTTKTLSSSSETVKNTQSQSASVANNQVTLANRKTGDQVRQGNDEPNLTGKNSSSIAGSERNDTPENIPLPIFTNQSNQTVSANESQQSTKRATVINSEPSDVAKNKNTAWVDYNLNEHQLGATVATNETVFIVPDEESILNKEQMNTDINLKSEQNLNQHGSIRNDQTSLFIVTDSVERIVDESEDALEDKNSKNDLTDSTSKQSVFSRIAIRATIAPDFSSEQFNSTDKMGYNYGVMVEYFLNRNFSVTTGALWSRKYYSAVDVEYNGYHADRAYGDCRMWDIPLNVNYYLTPSRQYSFFASAGFSSYLMNEENYDYEVDTNYGTRSYTSQVIKENNEWFKILNVSVGLQKQIGSRFAIQIEPFVKVPLAGVGEGNISLASFGGFFSVRYNF
jgi:hypothetical protein